MRIQHYKGELVKVVDGKYISIETEKVVGEVEKKNNCNAIRIGRGGVAY